MSMLTWMLYRYLFRGCAGLSSGVSGTQALSHACCFLTNSRALSSQMYLLTACRGIKLGSFTASTSSSSVSGFFFGKSLYEAYVDSPQARCRSRCTCRNGALARAAAIVLCQFFLNLKVTRHSNFHSLRHCAHQGTPLALLQSLSLTPLEQWFLQAQRR
jgi:hypothetical protein